MLLRFTISKSAAHRQCVRLSSSVATFKNQEKVPKLPIPSLENLKGKYLNSLKPILNGGDFKRSTKIVEEFLAEDGFGTELQNRLIEYGNDKVNWLEDLWLQKAYLEWREPSLINVNYWCQFVDHPDQPKDLITKPPPRGVLTAFQIKRAAGLISNMLNYNDMLNNQTLPAETIKDRPVCMEQYKKMFGTTRVPGPGCDTLVHQYPTTATHIIVMVRNLIYKVDVMGPGNTRVTIEEIERLLLACGRDSLERVSTKEKIVEIGKLTGGDRDNWWNAYSHLIELDSNNKNNMDIIQSALFAVCLDDVGEKANIDQSHLAIFHNHNGKNRWFDKSLQIIVSSSGKAGLNGEHTPADAVVPGNCTEYILKNEPARDPKYADSSLRLSQPYPLLWKIDSETEKQIKTAEISIAENILETQSCLLQTDIYGSRFMKEVAGTSPDAYIQMALQLTYYRLSKKPTAIYETASTRMFRHGRTETGRSTSTASVEFCRAFDNDSILYEDKRDLFKKAIAAQGGYMRSASLGLGIDRHMLGLRSMLKPEEKEKATMFTDPAYLESMYFRLSTSNMSPGKYFYGGFGPVVPEGYGVNYAIDKDSLKFSISNKRLGHKKAKGDAINQDPSKKEKETSCYKFREKLEQTLIDMFILFPKRTDVWGPGWQKKFEEEARNEYKMGQMRKLSDALLSRQQMVADSYKDKP